MLVSMFVAVFFESFNKGKQVVQSYLIMVTVILMQSSNYFITNSQLGTGNFSIKSKLQVRLGGGRSTGRSQSTLHSWRHAAPVQRTADCPACVLLLPCLCSGGQQRGRSRVHHPGGFQLCAAHHPGLHPRPGQPAARAPGRDPYGRSLDTPLRHRLGQRSRSALDGLAGRTGALGTRPRVAAEHAQLLERPHGMKHRFARPTHHSLASVMRAPGPLALRHVPLRQLHACQPASEAAGCRRHPPCPALTAWRHGRDDEAVACAADGAQDAARPQVRRRQRRPDAQQRGRACPTRSTPQRWC